MSDPYLDLPEEVYATIPNWFRFRYLGEIPERVQRYCDFVLRVKAKWPHRYQQMCEAAAARSKPMRPPSAL